MRPNGKVYHTEEVLNYPQNRIYDMSNMYSLLRFTILCDVKRKKIFIETCTYIIAIYFHDDRRFAVRISFNKGRGKDEMRAFVYSPCLLCNPFPFRILRK